MTAFNRMTLCLAGIAASVFIADLYDHEGRDMVVARRLTMMAAVLAMALVHTPALKAAAPDSPDILDRSAVVADLEAVRTGYLDRDRAFTPGTAARARVLLNRARARAGKMTRADLFVALAQIAATADNGHSGIRYRKAGALRPGRLPLRFIWFREGLLVARAYGADADLAGSRVVAVDGHPVAQVFARARTLAGGTDDARRINVADMIDRWGVLRALGMALRPDRVTLTLSSPENRTFQRTVRMMAEAPTAADEVLWLPQPIADETGWRPALAGDDDALPLYLRQGQELFRMVSMPAWNAAYVQFRNNESDGEHDIAAFVRRVRDTLTDERPKNLILDLRFDVGGNLTTTLSLMRDLPAMIPGRIAMLVGPYTFSAGIVSAAAVKKAGGDKVTIIGDAVGDRLRFWSEGGQTCLPNSHFCMRYTNGMFDLKSGCGAMGGWCFGEQFDVTVGSLTPAIKAPLTLIDYLHRRDPGLEAAGNLLSARSGIHKLDS